MLALCVLNKFAGTLGSAGREKMKTLHIVAERGRFPKALSSSPALTLINKKREIEGFTSAFE
jgi:hypothetical protein